MASGLDTFGPWREAPYYLRMHSIPVLIPAHNEEPVLGRCLGALLADAHPGEFRAIVVANGCTDRTAEVARSQGVEVLETPVGCKTTALNLGESVLGTDDFPRIYLDGDLVLTTATARAICRALDEPDLLAVAPTFHFDLSRSSWAVQSYYRVWETMPYFDAGRIAGAYALSREGRARFGAFPKLTSDDGYVRLHFAPHERRTLADHTVTVSAPRTLRDLIRIKTRSKFGTAELRERHPELFVNEQAAKGLSARRLLRNPALWHRAWVYVLVNLVAERRAARRSSSDVAWERDASSRASS